MPFGGLRLWGEGGDTELILCPESGDCENMEGEEATCGTVAITGPDNAETEFEGVCVWKFSCDEDFAEVETKDGSVTVMCDSAVRIMATSLAAIVATAALM